MRREYSRLKEDRRDYGGFREKVVQPGGEAEPGEACGVEMLAAFGPGKVAVEPELIRRDEVRPMDGEEVVAKCR